MTPRPRGVSIRPYCGGYLLLGAYMCAYKTFDDDRDRSLRGSRSLRNGTMREACREAISICLQLVVALRASRTSPADDPSLGCRRAG